MVRNQQMPMYFFCGHQKFGCVPDFQNFMTCGLKVNIETDFIEFRCCSVNGIKVAEDNVGFCDVKILGVYNNMVVLECCHP
jgi:hypothetical protein